MTSFEEIYLLNGSIQKEDNSNKPDNIYYFEMSNYLMFATGVFCEYSYIDITDYVPFSQNIYTFSTPLSQTEFTLDPEAPTDALFYVSVGGNELEDSEYSYNATSHVLTIPSGGGEVYVGAYIIGQFNNTLGIKEKIILADAMTEWFAEGHVNVDDQQTQIMFSGVEFHSQANNTKANLDVEKFRNGKSFRAMLLYTYSKNMPSTVNLAKRGCE